MPHIHELYDYVIAVYVVHDGKALLVNHPKYDLWLPIGGHVELDEDPESALYREIAEECGLDVKVLGDNRPTDATWQDRKILPSPAYIDVHTANEPHKHIAFTYFGVAKNSDGKLSEEHSEMRWFTLEDLDDPSYGISDPVKFYARAAIAEAAKPA